MPWCCMCIALLTLYLATWNPYRLAIWRTHRKSFRMLCWPVSQSCHGSSQTGLNAACFQRCNTDILMGSPENAVLFDSASIRLHPLRLTSAQQLVASRCGMCSTEFRNGPGALASFEASKGSTCFLGICSFLACVTLYGYKCFDPQVISFLSVSSSSHFSMAGIESAT